MTKATQTAHTVWLILLSFVSQGAVWVAFLYQWGSSREMDGACLGNVPSDAAFDGGAPRVVADITFFPVGRACIYETTSGGTTAVQTGQDVTFAAIIGTLVCVLSAVAAWVPWRRITPMQRLLPGVALFFLCTAWVLIWMHASVR